jgi:predicted CoA-binding protein
VETHEEVPRRARVVDEEAARLAREARLAVVMDRCMKKEHHRLMGPEVPS